jgi:hypothetical protein
VPAAVPDLLSLAQRRRNEDTHGLVSVRARLVNRIARAPEGADYHRYGPPPSAIALIVANTWSASLPDFLRYKLQAPTECPVLLSSTR